MMADCMTLFSDESYTPISFYLYLYLFKPIYFNLKHGIANTVRYACPEITYVLTTKAAKSLSLEIFKSCLDIALSNLIYLTFL